MNPTLAKTLQIFGLLIFGLIALKLLTFVVIGAVQLLLKIALLFGLCLVAYAVLTRVKS